MRIQKSLLAGLILSLTTIFTFPVHAGEDHAISTNRHCLWKVDGPHSVVYLLGSIHLLKRDDYPLDRPIETAFTNAQVAVFETDMDKLEQPEMQMTLMGKAQLPEGETLEQHLTPATYALFSNHVSRAGLPLAMFNRFKPFIAASAIAVIELQKLELDPAFGVDKYFSGRAAKEGKRVIPLESVDFQIDLLTGFSREEGELVMKTSLADMDKMKKEFKDIIN